MSPIQFQPRTQTVNPSPVAKPAARQVDADGDHDGSTKADAVKEATRQTALAQSGSIGRTLDTYA